MIITLSLSLCLSFLRLSLLCLSFSSLPRSPLNDVFPFYCIKLLDDLCVKIKTPALLCYLIMSHHHHHHHHFHHPHSIIQSSSNTSNVNVHNSPGHHHHLPHQPSPLLTDCNTSINYSSGTNPSPSPPPIQSTVSAGAGISSSSTSTPPMIPFHNQFNVASAHPLTQSSSFSASSSHFHATSPPPPPLHHTPGALASASSSSSLHHHPLSQNIVSDRIGPGYFSNRTSFDRDDEMGPPGSLYYFTSSGSACIPSSSFSASSSSYNPSTSGNSISDRFANTSASYHTYHPSHGSSASTSATSAAAAAAAATASLHHPGHRGSSSSSHLFDNLMSTAASSSSTPCMNTGDRIGPNSGPSCPAHHRRESFLYRGETNDAYEASPKSISRHSSIGSGDL